MEINIRNSAIKDSKTIAHKDKEKIYAKILELKNFPAVLNVKKLTNFEPAYRLRVGDYRILFDVTEDTIEIGRILHRKESYK
jgi:mRNA interferase RelE/StbE